MPLSTKNPYLEGNYAPVRDERYDRHLVVEGTIPPELDGRLLRNGANPILDPDPSMYHWFFGDGMVHSIELSNGEAHYRNRWVRTPAACTALGEPAPDWVPEVNGIPSVANTSIVQHAGRVLATVETSLPTEISDDLATVGALDFDGVLTSSFTAHPQFDSVTGEMLFFGYDPLGPPYVRYHVADASGRLVQSSVIEIPRPIMMHTFAATASRVLWFDLPVAFDAELLGVRPMPFAWRPEHGARVGVMSRSDYAGVTWIDIEPCYLYHAINAYDVGANVVVDVVRYPDNYETDPYGIGASSPPRLERWTVDTIGRRVDIRTLDDTSQEFPRINDAFAMRRNRYGYAAEASVGLSSFTLNAGLRKHDLREDTVERHDFGPGHAAGEPIFVAAADDLQEDAGWILCVVYDEANDTSDLIILDATRFAAAPVATIHLPRRIPYGFHGSWLPSRVSYTRAD